MSAATALPRASRYVRIVSSVLTQHPAEPIPHFHPQAFIGFPWPAQDDQFDEKFRLQVGEPEGACEERAGGVFARRWTKGEVVLDCNTWEAVLPFQSF